MVAEDIFMGSGLSAWNVDWGFFFDIDPLVRINFGAIAKMLSLLKDDDEDDSIVISLDDKKFTMLRENGVKFVGHYDPDEQRKLREEEDFGSRWVSELSLKLLSETLLTITSRSISSLV